LSIKTAGGPAPSTTFSQFLSKYTIMFLARIDVKIQQLFLFMNIILQVCSLLICMADTFQGLL
jgi:hypothetical protein